MSRARWRFSGGLAIFSLGMLIALPAGVAWSQEEIEFNRDIRPILSDHCFQCHGPDRNTREADLRLDTESGLLGLDGQEGVIVRGSAQTSPLYQRLVSDDPEVRMPPPESHKELTAEKIALLAKWIDGGASYEGHWAYLPVRPFDRQALPSQVTSDSQVIDHFVGRKLDQLQLVASPAENRTTLLRRLYFDLTGLPPSPVEVREFLADDAPDAYLRVVERLLASPHYGERMAIWWLDLVRYADTVGYHGDQDMSVSPYRDYVIDSFNENKPFDQFTIEQLAGDLLPNPTRDQQIASGYNRLGMMSAEGGVQDKEYLAKYIAERVRNVSGTWLGVTMGCCECHDHKFDPLSTREFYQMEAFFADIQERGLYAGANSDGNWGPSIKVPTAAQQSLLTSLDQSIARVEGTLGTSTEEILAAQRQWEGTQALWSPLTPTALHSLQGVTLTLRDDQSILATGNNPATDTYRLTFENVPAGITAIRLEVLPDDSLPQKGPGRASNGNFVLSELIAEARTRDGGEGQEGVSPRPVSFVSAMASYEQTGAAGDNPYGKWAVAAAIDRDEKGAKWGWAIMEQVGRSHDAIFEIAPESAPAAGETLVIQLLQNLDNPQHTIGRFRLWITTSPMPSSGVTPVPSEIASIIHVAPAERTPEQSATIAAYYRSLTPLLQSAREELERLKKERANLDAQIATTLVTRSVAPRMVRVLPRGNWMDESGEVVEPGFPAAIEVPSFQQSATGDPARDRLTREDLARWITARDHPLTSRVLVNRLWKLCFGAGLSRSLDDLGAQGQAPSHPELLDFLARQLVDSNWNLKQLLRSIVLSETYQRSSLATAVQLESDPDNRWLARQSRFRLDAELVRDNALAASGLLVRDIGGRSVKPYQPAGYWAYLNFPTREWQSGSGSELYRRGLYTHWQRQYLHPSLLAFDAPSREECTADRPRSNTPLQSLALLNDPSYVEAARALATMLLKEGGSGEQERLDVLFWQVLSRPADDAEKEVLRGLLQRTREQYQNQPELALAVTGVGQLPAPQEIDRMELAVWMAVTRVILNLHESITRN